MKSVLEYIGSRAAEFSERPLFRYLRNESIDPVERLSFVPCIAPFVMTFSDLYRLLTVAPGGDRYQQLVNAHLAEEDGHWKWFLSDLRNLDLDPTMRFTDALRFLWSDETVRGRMLVYEMCLLAAGRDSLSKLVLVHSIEATGQAGLAAAATVGREAAKRLGRKLVYFGRHHLETEQHHTLEDDSIRRSLEEVVLDSARRDEMRQIVDGVFTHFAAFVDEAHEFAVNKRSLVVQA